MSLRAFLFVWFLLGVDAKLIDIRDNWYKLDVSNDRNLLPFLGLVDRMKMRKEIQVNMGEHRAKNVESVLFRMSLVKDLIK